MPDDRLHDIDLDQRGVAGLRHPPILFSSDEETDVGGDHRTPVDDDYSSAGSHFNGRIDWIQIDLGEDANSANQFITAEWRY